MNICPVCHTGKLVERRLPYVEWHDSDLILVDYIPALLCDVCGERHYDRDALGRLERLLWLSPPRPTAGRTASSRRRSPHASRLD